MFSSAKTARGPKAKVVKVQVSPRGLFGRGHQMLYGIAINLRHQTSLLQPREGRIPSSEATPLKFQIDSMKPYLT